ncbi:MAG TPA: hypothetical protein VFJ05_03885 [Nitrososphaeraceae archaeon]|nr:hypothetical protein [Nitrososphaeraceae archaeon]
MALDSLIESIRNDPAKHSPLIHYYNNMSPTTRTNSFCMYGGEQQQQQYIPSQDYFIEYYSGSSNILNNYAR